MAASAAAASSWRGLGFQAGYPGLGGDVAAHELIFRVFHVEGAGLVERPHTAVADADRLPAILVAFQPMVSMTSFVESRSSRALPGRTGWALEIVLDVRPGVRFSLRGRPPEHRHDEGHEQNGDGNL